MGACTASEGVWEPGKETAGPSTALPRISYFALLARTTCAALRRESRMQIIEATGLDRKSGGAQWRDLRFPFPVLTHPLQAFLTGWFQSQEKNWPVKVATEQRLQVSSTRVRVPDVMLVSRGPQPEIIVDPPVLVVEILSPDDSYTETQSRASDYLRMGVSCVWIIDPTSRTGRQCIGDARTAADTLAVPGTEIRRWIVGQSCHVYLNFRVFRSCYRLPVVYDIIMSWRFVQLLTFRSHSTNGCETGRKSPGPPSVR